MQIKVFVSSQSVSNIRSGIWFLRDSVGSPGPHVLLKNFFHSSFCQIYSVLLWISKDGATLLGQPMNKIIVNFST